ncbi:hypothetical protein HPB50_029365 [Hyalomma asiaticum]|nr:hypothetical protein HPB50_029365 [Hyalomma asiaticum]
MRTTRSEGSVLLASLAGTVTYRYGEAERRSFEEAQTKKAFMRSVSGTRKTWLLLMGKVTEKPAQSDHASNNPVPNPDALLQLKLAFEAEIRFKDAVEAVEAKLSKMQEILDWGNLMGLEEFLRPKKADAEAFTTAQELGNRSPPDPCISKKNGNFEIACKENIVALPPASSPDKAAILLFTVYFIVNL